MTSPPDRSIRVLVVARSTTSHALSGGMEMAYEQVVRDLLGAGFRVALLTTSEGRGSTLPVYERVWEVPSRPGRYSRRWWKQTKNHKESSEWDADVILSISHAAAAMIGPARPPIIAQCHGTAWSEVKSSFGSLSLREAAKIPINTSRSLSQAFIYRRFDAVVAVGEPVRQQLRSRWHGVKESRLTLIENGLDPATVEYRPYERESLRRSLGVGSGSCLQLSLGRLQAQKGVDTAIAALALPTCSNDVLAICGDGPDRRRLERHAMRLGVSDRVRFLGAIPHGEVGAFMSAADVFVFPTRRHEGLPLVILEALAVGLPVVTTERAAVPISARSVITVVAADEDSIAGAVSRVSIQGARTSLLPVELTRVHAAGQYKTLVEELAYARAGSG